MRGKGHPPTLTDREITVLTLAGEGNTDKAIAELLGISKGTVVNYWMRIRLKLGAASRTEAVALYNEKIAESLKAEGQELLSKLTEQQEVTGRLRQVQGQLEKRVNERTSELLDANAKLRDEIIKRSQTEQALKSSEDRYRNLYDYAEVAMIQSRIDGGEILEVNNKFLELFGGTREEFIGHPSTMIWADKASREEFVSQLKIKGHVTDFECQLVSLQGTISTCVISASLYRQQGFVEGTIVDISARKQAEALLLERDRELTILLKNLPGMAYRCDNDRDWTMRYVSDGSIRLTGFHPEDLVNNHRIAYGRLILEDFRQGIWEKWQTTLANHQEFEDEYPIRTSSGEVKWVWERGRGVYDEAANLMFLEGYVEDITDRKQSEVAILESEQRFRAIANYTYDWETWHGIDGRPKWISESVTTLTGYSIDECYQMDDYPLAMVVEQDKDSFLSTFQYAVTARTQGNDLEFRIYRRSGEQAYMAMSWQPAFSDQGQYLGIRTSVRDITERKKSESQMRFQAMLLDQTRDMVTATDLEGQIVYVNEALCQMMDRDRDSLIGTTIHTFFDEDTYGESPDDVIDITRKTGGWEGEFASAHDNRDVFVSCRTSLVRDTSGRAIGMCGVINDISNKKIIETNLQRDLIRGNRMLELYEKSDQMSDKELYDYVLDVAVELTGSKIGFFHLIAEDQNTILLTTWNREALKNCSALYDYHYPISQAGNWVDCVRQRKPIVYNDFKNSPNQMGLPKGHSPINRFMAIPVIDQDLVKIIFGVGNKEREYDDNDIHQIELIASDVNKLLIKRRLDKALADSEQRVSSKLKSILEPEGSLQELELKDVLDIPEIEGLCDAIYAVCQVGVRIMDLEGKVLIATGIQDICSTFHLLHPEASEDCLEVNPSRLGEIEQGVFKLYQCKNRLWDLVTPLFIGGRHLGNLLLGQFFFDYDDFDIEFYQKNADQYGFEETKYLQALAQVPRWSQQTVSKAMDLYTKLAQFISTLSYSNLRLARSLAEKEQTNELLNVSEKRYRTVVENMSDWVWEVDPRLRFTYASAKVERILGYKSEELIGRTPYEFMPPEEADRLQGVLEEILLERKPFNDLINLCIHRDGHEVVLCSSGTPTFDVDGEFVGYRGCDRDITDKRRAEDALKESEDTYRRQFDDSLCAMLIVDPNSGQILHANESAVKFYGYPKDQFLTMSVFDLCTLPAQDITEKIAGLQSGGGGNFEVNHRLAGGEIRTVEVFASSIRFEGRTVLHSIVHDITERKRAEEALLKSNQTSMDIVRAIPSGLYIFQFVEPDKLILINGNKAAEQLTGLNTDDWINHEYNEIFPQARMAGITEQFLNVVRTGTTYETEDMIYEDDRVSGAFRVRAFALPNERLAVAFENITEQRNLDVAIRQSEQKYRMLFEEMTQGAFIHNAEGILVEANPAALNLFGLTRDDLRNRTPSAPDWDVVLEDGTPLSGTEHPSMVALRTGEPVSDIIVGIVNAQSGERVWVEVNAIPEFRPGEVKPYQVMVTMHDITERRRAEEDYVMLFRKMLDGFSLHEIICDDAGEPIDYRFIAVNPAFERLTGLRAEDLIGRTVLEVMPNTEKEWIKKFGRVALTGEPDVFENYAQEIGKHFEVSAYQPSPGMFACISVDITMRKEAEKLQRESREELEQRVTERTAQLENANRELESFSYSVSHDLKSPLRTLEGFSKILLMDYGSQLDQDGQFYLNRISAAADTMGALIDGLLCLSRVNRADLRLSKIDLSSMSKEIFSALQETTKDRLVELHVEDNIRVEGDLSLIRSLMENLIGNAWKYTSHKKRAVIKIGVTRRDGKKAYYVKDNGAGFDMAYVDKLFEAFHRLHDESEFPGVGIGLATVKRIVTRHNGEVWAEGEASKGSTFFFTLKAR